MSVRHRMARAMTTALLAAAAWLPAQAAVVVGTFDPPFGPGIPNLGFRGSLTVRVPDACFQLPSGLIANSDLCSGGQMAVLAASVELYNTSTPGLPTLLTLNFSPATMLVSGALTYFDSDTGVNQLANLDTSASAPLPVSLHDPGQTSVPLDDVHFDGTLALQLFAAEVVIEGPKNGAFLVACGRPPGSLPNDPCTFTDSSRMATMVFQPRQNETPEPGSLALAFSALAAAAWGRRRAAAATRPA